MRYGLVQQLTKLLTELLTKHRQKKTIKVTKNTRLYHNLCRLELLYDIYLNPQTRLCLNIVTHFSAWIDVLK